MCLPTLARRTLTAIAILLVACSLLGSSWQEAWEWTPVRQWWGAMAGLSLLVMARTLSGPWCTSGLLGGTFLLGFSSQLYLTQPRWYPSLHIRPESGFDYLPLLSILFQAAICAAVLVKLGRFGAMRDLVGRLGLVRIAILAAGILLISVSAMGFIGQGDLPGLVNEMVTTGLLWALHVVSLFLFAVSLPKEELLRLEVPANARAGGVRRLLDTRLFPRAVALIVLVLCATVNRLAFQGLPHLQDEVVYLFQAECLLHGGLGAPAPPPDAIEALELYLLRVSNGEWFSVTFPGWPAVLALGVAIDLPWLVNPVLAALCVLLAHSVFRQLADRGTANLVIVLLATSPWFIATSATLMVHTLTLCCLLSAWAALLRARQGQHALFGFLAGAAMGIFFLTRPYEAVLFGTLTGLWVLRWIKLRGAWQIVGAYGLGCILASAPLFLFNAHFTGELLTTPINQYIDETWHPGANKLGFGSEIGPNPTWTSVDLYPGHSPREALIHTQHSLQAVNVELLGWATGSLLILLYFVSRGRFRAVDVSMLILCATTILAYFPYWYSGTFYVGPRYWFMLLLPMIVLTACAIRATWTDLHEPTFDPSTRWRFAVAVCLLCGVALASFLPWRTFTRYKDYRGYHGKFRALARSELASNALVFVKTSRTADFDSAFALNSPTLPDNEPIFVRDLGPEKNRVTAAAFPERPQLFVEPDPDDDTVLHIRDVLPPARPTTSP